MRPPDVAKCLLSELASGQNPCISFAIPPTALAVLIRIVPPRFPALLRAIAFFVLLAFLPAPSSARSKSPAVDPDYVYALATANQFLHAWQVQDQETAILLLSDHLKQHTPDSALGKHLNSRGKPQSFEIGRGKKLAAGRYQFPIALFPTPANARWMRPQATALVVVKTGKSDWAIDKLP